MPGKDLLPAADPDKKLSSLRYDGWRFRGASSTVERGTPMHELSIAMSLVQTAVRHAEAEGARSVQRVKVRVGALSGVEPDALSFCFPVAARESLCEGADLDLEIVPGAGTCPACGATSEVRDLMAPCPTCGSWPLAVEGGRDLALDSLEVT